MTEPADDIAAGRAAWVRIRDYGRRFWAEWKSVSKALAIGRAEAMAQAKANRPLGTRYVRLFGAWLRQHGFDEIDTQQRYRALLCLEHEADIERWRATLSDKRRNRLNHPGAVWMHWKRTTRPASEPKAPAIRTTSGKARPIFWSQDHVRRAHRAMVDSLSFDLMKLARVALEGAIRDENDLKELLDERPRRPMPAATAVHATA